MKRRLFLSLVLWPVPALAHSLKHGQIAIGHAWALPSAIPDGQVFMPLLNEGNAADALVAARTVAAAFVELRRNARYDDPAETQFDLDPGKPLAMRPQARHLRLVGLTKPLQAGDRFTIVLDFLKAGEIELECHVENVPGD